ncbi:ASCH domain-containing protein [Cupriavidus sp. TMH.W2]|uniref:ASCH domain-containing protein n=1 Tax=Cupriavidus sp. TMH.W2 TaxID=3434465 RepID=UPI003D77CEBF
MAPRRTPSGAGHSDGPPAAPLRVLRLHVMAEYFHAIRERTKPLEFRLDTPYWRRRLVGRTYDAVEVAHGYPKADDATRRVRRAWRGVAPQVLTHQHFGEALAVLAIDVTGDDLPLAP